MLQSLRLFKAKNPDFLDLTIVNQAPASSFKPEISTVNYIYLSQQYPFNNFFAWIKTPNITASKLKVEYWSGNTWIAMADIIDATSVDGTSLAQSGVVYFSPEPASSWDAIADSSKVAEINSTKIFDSYWLRISADADIGATCELKEISYCFADSYTVDGIDSEVFQYITNIEAGKTDWIKELVMASKFVIMDLKRHNVIRNSGQLLSIEEVSIATAYRALMVIYNHLGGSFLDKMRNAQAAYDKAISLRSFTVDKNKNALIDNQENEQRQSRLIR